MYRTIALRSISILISSLFLAQQIAWAAPVIPAISNTKPLNSSATSLQLPAAVARIGETYTAPRSERTLYLFQDAHTNESGQINLAQALAEVMRTKRIQYVFTEAGRGDDSLTFLKSYGTQTVRTQVGLSYLRKGLIKGTEFLSFTHDTDFVLWGVEDAELYEESVDVYRATVKRRAELDRYLDRIEVALKLLGPKLLSGELKDYLELRNQIDEGERSLTETHVQLMRLAQRIGLSLESYPALKALSEIKSQESRIDFQRAQQEQVKLLETLPQEKRSAFNNPTESKGAFKLSVTDFDKQIATHAHLKQAYAELHGARAFDQNFPELANYNRYLHSASQLSVPAILKEQTALDRELLGRLIETDVQGNFFTAWDYLTHLRKLFGLSFEPGDFETFQRRFFGYDFVTLTGFINRQLAEQATNLEQVIFLKSGLEEALTNAMRFYELTLARDEVFVTEVLAKLASEGLKEGILVTGGYHTENLKEILKRQNISYAVIIPQVYHSTNHTRYERLLLSQNPTRPIQRSHHAESVATLDSVRSIVGQNTVHAFVASVGRVSKWSDMQAQRAQSEVTAFLEAYEPMPILAARASGARAAVIQDMVVQLGEAAIDTDPVSRLERIKKVRGMLSDKRRRFTNQERAKIERGLQDALRDGLRLLEFTQRLAQGEAIDPKDSHDQLLLEQATDYGLRQGYFGNVNVHTNIKTFRSGSVDSEYYHDQLKDLMRRLNGRVRLILSQEDPNAFRNDMVGLLNIMDQMRQRQSEIERAHQLFVLKHPHMRDEDETYNSYRETMEAAWHIILDGGKKTRPYLITLFYGYMGMYELYSQRVWEIALRIQMLLRGQSEGLGRDQIYLNSSDYTPGFGRIGFGAENRPLSELPQDVDFTVYVQPIAEEYRGPKGLLAKYRSVVLDGLNGITDESQQLQRLAEMAANYSAGGNTEFARVAEVLHTLTTKGVVLADAQGQVIDFPEKPNIRYVLDMIQRGDPLENLMIAQISKRVAWNSEENLWEMLDAFDQLESESRLGKMRETIPFGFYATLFTAPGRTQAAWQAIWMKNMPPDVNPQAWARDGEALRQAAIKFMRNKRVYVVNVGDESRITDLGEAAGFHYAAWERAFTVSGKIRSGFNPELDSVDSWTDPTTLIVEEGGKLFTHHSHIYGEGKVIVEKGAVVALSNTIIYVPKGETIVFKAPTPDVADRGDAYNFAFVQNSRIEGLGGVMHARSLTIGYDNGLVTREARQAIKRITPDSHINVAPVQMLVTLGYRGHSVMGRLAGANHHKFSLDLSPSIPDNTGRAPLQQMTLGFDGSPRNFHEALSDVDLPQTRNEKLHANIDTLNRRAMQDTQVASISKAQVEAEPAVGEVEVPLDYILERLGSRAVDIKEAQWLIRKFMQSHFDKAQTDTEKVGLLDKLIDQLTTNSELIASGVAHAALEYLDDQRVVWKLTSIARQKRVARRIETARQMTLRARSVSFSGKSVTNAFWSGVVEVHNETGQRIDLMSPRVLDANPGLERLYADGPAAFHNKLVKITKTPRGRIRVTVEDKTFKRGENPTAQARQHVSQNPLLSVFHNFARQVKKYEWLNLEAVQKESKISFKVAREALRRLEQLGLVETREEDGETWYRLSTQASLNRDMVMEILDQVTTGQVPSDELYERVAWHLEIVTDPDFNLEARFVDMEINKAIADAEARGMDPYSVLQLSKRFRQIFREHADVIARARGRLNFGGAHTDWAGFRYVLGIAIHMATNVAVRVREDRKVIIHAHDMPEGRRRVELELPADINVSLKPRPKDHPQKFADYIIGIIEYLRKAGVDVPGLEIYVSGDMPQGTGLSSSAAIEMAFIMALLEALQVRLSTLDVQADPDAAQEAERVQMIEITRKAENFFVGVLNGYLDQGTVALAVDGKIVILSTRRGKEGVKKVVDFPLDQRVRGDNHGDYVTAIFDSGTSRSLVRSAFNERVRWYWLWHLCMHRYLGLGKDENHTLMISSDSLLAEDSFLPPQYAFYDVQHPASENPLAVETDSGLTTTQEKVKDLRDRIRAVPGVTLLTPEQIRRTENDQLQSLVPIVLRNEFNANGDPVDPFEQYHLVGAVTRDALNRLLDAGVLNQGMLENMEDVKGIGRYAVTEEERVLITGDLLDTDVLDNIHTDSDEKADYRRLLADMIDDHARGMLKLLEDSTLPWNRTRRIAWEKWFETQNKIADKVRNNETLSAWERVRATGVLGDLSWIGKRDQFQGDSSDRRLDRLYELSNIFRIVHGPGASLGVAGPGAGWAGMMASVAFHKDKVDLFKMWITGRDEKGQVVPDKERAAFLKRIGIPKGVVPYAWTPELQEWFEKEPTLIETRPSKGSEIIKSRFRKVGARSRIIHAADVIRDLTSDTYAVAEQARRSGAALRGRQFELILPTLLSLIPNGQTINVLLGHPDKETVLKGLMWAGRTAETMDVHEFERDTPESHEMKTKRLRNLSARTIGDLYTQSDPPFRTHVIEILNQALKSTNERERAFAALAYAETLARRYWMSAPGQTFEARSAYKQELVRKDNRRLIELGVVPVLLQALRDESVHVRRQIPHILALLGDSIGVQAAPALIESLGTDTQAPDSDVKVRADVAALLGQIYLPELGEEILTTLSRPLADEDVSVRKAAYVALGRIGPPAKNYRAHLNTALRDPSNTEAQAFIVQAIGSIGLEGLSVREFNRVVLDMIWIVEGEHGEIDTLTPHARRDAARVLGQWAPQIREQYTVYNPLVETAITALVAHIRREVTLVKDTERYAAEESKQGSPKTSLNRRNLVWQCVKSLRDYGAQAAWALVYLKEWRRFPNVSWTYRGRTSQHQDDISEQMQISFVEIERLGLAGDPLEEPLDLLNIDQVMQETWEQIFEGLAGSRSRPLDPREQMLLSGIFALLLTQAHASERVAVQVGADPSRTVVGETQPTANGVKLSPAQASEHTPFKTIELTHNQQDEARKSLRAQVRVKRESNQRTQVYSKALSNSYHRSLSELTRRVAASLEKARMHKLQPRFDVSELVLNNQDPNDFEIQARGLVAGLIQAKRVANQELLTVRFKLVGFEKLKPDQQELLRSLITRANQRLGSAVIQEASEIKDTSGWLEPVITSDFGRTNPDTLNIAFEISGSRLARIAHAAVLLFALSGDVSAHIVPLEDQMQVAWSQVSPEDLSEPVQQALRSSSQSSKADSAQILDAIGARSETWFLRLAVRALTPLVEFSIRMWRQTTEELASMA